MASIESNNYPLVSSNYISEKTKSVEYPIRGRLHFRTIELKHELQEGTKKDFDSVIHLNIGDVHAFGQRPITFVRQVISLCLLPIEQIDKSDFPEDAKERARRILSSCNGGAIGSYTDVTGLDVVKNDIATYITERDGMITCDPKNICLTSGATDGIDLLVRFFDAPCNEKPTGFLIPVPTYSCYTAAISCAHAISVRYYLDEDNDWAMNTKELERAYNDSLDHCSPRAICIINPGNPTGTVLTEENIKSIIAFAYEKKLLIISDEVYQLNVYDENLKFHSFRKVAYNMGSPYREMEIVSLNSASKGFSGECGLRAAYIEFHNFSDEMRNLFYKFVCFKSCTSTIGQACLSAITNPPKENEPSYELFKKETAEIFNSLKERAELVTKLFNSIEGIKCRTVSGALYAFPRIEIPIRAIEHAKSLNIEPDDFYCSELLEQTGICVAPGTAFGQKKDTYHFRATSIVKMDKMRIVVTKFEEFHKKFINFWK